MFNSWLKPISEKKNSTNSESSLHEVLKTPLKAPLDQGQEEILFACGCFWGAEKCFWKLPGVVTTAVGYSGGELANPTYNQVCSGRTGHTEVVRVVWNTSIIDLSDLLKMFWECHDPTQGERQGGDQGSQYRSAIYGTDSNQIDLALASRDSYQDSLTKNGFGKITTEIKKDQIFYFAEDYHQQYLAKLGNRQYCSAMPTEVSLGDFRNSNYKLKQAVWANFDWKIRHCVLRSDNKPISL